MWCGMTPPTPCGERGEPKYMWVAMLFLVELCWSRVSVLACLHLSPPHSGAVNDDSAWEGQSGCGS